MNPLDFNALNYNLHRAVYKRFPSLMKMPAVVSANSLLASGAVMVMNAAGPIKAGLPGGCVYSGAGRRRAMRLRFSRTVLLKSVGNAELELRDVWFIARRHRPFQNLEYVDTVKDLLLTARKVVHGF